MEDQNARLTQFEEVKELVVANAVKNVPSLKKKKSGTNTSLMAFQ
jgi:hypothetical protein